MAIEITQEEQWALNMLTNSVITGQQELEKRMAGRNALVSMLEGKYNAVYDPQTSEFKPKPKEKE